MKKQNSELGHLPQLTFICVGTKLKPGEGSISLDNVIKRFSRNRTIKPILDADILETILKNQSLIPKNLRNGLKYLMVLKKRKSRKFSECIDAITHNSKGWVKTMLYPVDYYCEGDYVICSKN